MAELETHTSVSLREKRGKTMPGLERLRAVVSGRTFGYTQEKGRYRRR